MNNEPLAWYIAGPLIGLMVPLLLFLQEKQFGLSSSYRYLWSRVTKRIPYFSYNEKADQWQFQFALGLILAGCSACWFGFDDGVSLTGKMPLYAVQAATVYSQEHLLWFLIGGILVGFGSRYANGCTAGHCIMGVSQFSLSSILATCSFFIGGLIVSYFVIPYIF